MMNQLFQSQEVRIVTVPTVIGGIVAELYDRGVSRAKIAQALDIKLPVVSQIKHGRTSVSDDKIPALAELHGGYTPRQLIAMKWIEWLEREKGVHLQDLNEAAKLSRKKRK